MNDVLWRRVGQAVTFAICLAATVVPAMGSERQPPVLNPKTYRSPSGEYELKVVPSDMHGRFHASYRVSKKGVEFWADRLPFTLWDAGITDSGVVAGYGYTHGWRGYGKGGIRDGPGDFVVAIISADGKVRLQEVTKRTHSRQLHAPPDPLAAGMIIDHANDRMLVRINEISGSEAWWEYRLSTAAATNKLFPGKWNDSKAARFIIDAKPVAGTPLTLVHWWRSEGKNLGARFTLVDRAAKPVWSFELKKDYNIPDSEDAQYQQMYLVKRRGAILGGPAKRRFRLRLFAKSQQVTFAVKPSATGSWIVTEVSRAPHSLPKKVEPTIPQRPLKSLGKLVLRGPRKTPLVPIRRVDDFAFDGQGRIAFLREDDDQPAFFVLIDQAGKVLREIRLDVDDNRDAKWTDYAWVGGNRFVITRSVSGVNGKSKAWSVDVGTGKLSPIRGFDCPWVDRLAGFSNGGFVALVTVRSRFTLEQTVLGFDARGKRIWTLPHGEIGPGKLFSPSDVAVTSTGQVAVIDVIQHTIQFFDRGGKYLKTVQLAKAWGRSANYPSGVTADIQGGLLVSDFDGSPRYVRMGSDGSVRRGFQPKHKDGRPVDSGHIRVAPDGRCWTCDGFALTRFKDSGVVDRLLGAPPDPSRIGNVAAVTIDQAGRIYAVDYRTGGIHVFGPRGKFLHVCKTQPADNAGKLFAPAVTTTDAGDVYLSVGNIVRGRRGEYLHFSATGKRLGVKLLRTDRWYFQPGTGNGLALAYEQAYLVSPTGKTLRSINRRPDGSWLERPYRASIAPDGSFAILAQNSDRPGTAANLYKRDGAPVRTITLPDAIGRYPEIAFDGRRLVVAGNGLLIVYDGQGVPLQMFSTGSKKNPDDNCRPFLAPGGRELILFDGKSAALHRYEMR